MRDEDIVESTKDDSKEEKLVVSQEENTVHVDDNEAKNETTDLENIGKKKVSISSERLSIAKTRAGSDFLDKKYSVDSTAYAFANL
eukprot:CAMPEP_0170526514 /NCGR_PEP_ID=MMETSP0209-20121228/11903_1 /TAXON_ID=665100 ORGANISM="Litonotus pictus, Strain P1" /NCGR_SAMPLE_ID=MMETSP0209 /ASSEMBLY_ACC=CAM_ASM_000301 /LENGTH=85 /DNA_ID=CAMNT_0010816359 /DNA_START=180 /DNA_END=437 /DNA_ORIENTATION=+